jgi:hypothetical protein
MRVFLEFPEFLAADTNDTISSAPALLRLSPALKTPPGSLRRNPLNLVRIRSEPFKNSDMAK